MLDFLLETVGEFIAEVVVDFIFGVVILGILEGAQAGLPYRLFPPQTFRPRF